MDNFQFSLAKDMELKIKALDRFTTLEKWSSLERCPQMIISAPEIVQSRLCSFMRSPTTNHDEFYAKFKDVFMMFVRKRETISDPSEYIRNKAIAPGDDMATYVERLRDTKPNSLLKLPEDHRVIVDLRDNLTLDSLVSKPQKLRSKSKTDSANAIQSQNAQQPRQHFSAKISFKSLQNIACDGSAAANVTRQRTVEARTSAIYARKKDIQNIYAIQGGSEGSATPFAYRGTLKELALRFNRTSPTIVERKHIYLNYGRHIYKMVLCNTNK
ncbi:hypothetical protein RF11_15338 [Thelohanellus kitauei]|uniref:Uncharacterized protein n=1 Tax=Thelohanellus kitauei TaxID=669202 RepID=A0A0C2MEX1_THEKT|nr:hypothetical protein RF11_15338 [Thelohanellus kitauei]